MIKLATFVCVGAASLAVAVGMPQGPGLTRPVTFLTYPALFLAFAVWGLSLYHLHRREWSFRRLLPRKRHAYGLILGVSGLLLLYEPFAFKIVLDEVLLSTTAEFMHLTRLAGLPQAANDYGGVYLLQQAVMDKRPFFFPFLLSLVHDLAGYRYANVFALNALLTVLLMGLIYGLSTLLSNHRGGILAVLLAGAVPLLSLMATSGHFEILNLVMLCVTLILAYAYTCKPTGTRLVPLVFSLILLSQVRYENAIYLIPFGMLILLGWKKARAIILPWPVLVSPVFFILPLLHYRVMLGRESTLFQAGPNGRDATFALGYAGENLQSAFTFLYSVGFTQPNALMVSILGAISLFLFCAYAWKRSAACAGRDPKATVVFVFLVAIALLSVVIAFFNYGLFHDHVTARLSLPLHLFWILLIPFMATRMGRNFQIPALLGGLLIAAIVLQQMTPQAVRQTGLQFAAGILVVTLCSLWIWRLSAAPTRDLCLLVAAYLLTVSMPVSHAHQYSQKYISNDMIMAELEFLEARMTSEKILWVSSAPYSAMLLRLNCAPTVLLAANPEMVRMHLEQDNYDSIYVSQRLVRAGQGPFELIDKRDFLDREVFQMETIQTRRFGVDKRHEILRLTAVAAPEEPCTAKEGD
jgi:hypothetical protein